MLWGKVIETAGNGSFLAMNDTENTDWLDRFEFLEPLGGGGMGEVYLCQDRANNNQLCVVKKIITERKDLSTQAELIRIGQREAEFLRKLNHRGIVKFLDDFYNPMENGLYVVMEYVPGNNLEAIVQKEGCLNSETVIRIAIQCCDVLEYLHSAEPPVIYRDLKPSNLMLRPDGLVVFVDFGIARDFDPQDGPATRVVTSGYSPPEQYFGKPEPRGDLYSLGATMHHLLTGVRPKPLNPCSPKNLNNAVLAELDSLTKRLTAHDKDQRPSSAREVQYELFTMYKKIHPEFEIPEIDFDTAGSSPAERVSRPEGGARGESSKKARKGTSRSIQGERRGGSTSSGDSSNLFDKVKQWFGNLTGKRLH